MIAHAGKDYLKNISALTIKIILPQKQQNRSHKNLNIISKYSRISIKVTFTWIIHAYLWKNDKNIHPKSLKLKSSHPGHLLSYNHPLHLNLLKQPWANRKGATSIDTLLAQQQSTIRYSYKIIQSKTSSLPN